MSCSIGKFQIVHYHPIANKYEYHIILLFLFVKHECNNLMKECFLEENNDVMIDHDYAEALKAQFDTEIQSEAFDSNSNIYIYFSACEYHNKYHNDVRSEVNVKADFHSHFLYESAHNADTTF